MIKNLALVTMILSCSQVVTFGSSIGSSTGWLSKFLPQLLGTGVAPTDRIDDRYHNVSQIVEENGFAFEAHEVTTDDGYILGLHRVMDMNVTTKDGAPKPVVLMQHGIMDCSAAWVVNDADKAPAFMLARAGFDVWLGNARGNMYSQRHVNLTKNQKEFWDFDFEEMGLFDQPAFIEHIFNITGVKKIAAYIGHSQGTSAMFIGSSMKPDYFKERVGIFIAFAPIVRLDHTKVTIAVWASQFWAQAQELILGIEFYDIIPRTEIMNSIYGTLCNAQPHICIAMDEGFFDWDEQIDNAERYAVKMTHSPAGSGWRCMIHYAQIINATRFQRFDYGQAGNQEKYHQDTPPAYDLSKIDLPIGIAHGDVDQLSDMVDNKWLIEESGLRSNDTVKFNHLYHFGHNSFAMANNMTWFQDDIIAYIQAQEEYQPVVVESISGNENVKSDDGCTNDSECQDPTFPVGYCCCVRKPSERRGDCDCGECPPHQAQFRK